MIVHVLAETGMSRGAKALLSALLEGSEIALICEVGLRLMQRADTLFGFASQCDSREREREYYSNMRRFRWQRLINPVKGVL
jgi:hypothetical protein